MNQLFLILRFGVVVLAVMLIAAIGILLSSFMRPQVFASLSPRSFFKGFFILTTILGSSIAAYDYRTLEFETSSRIIPSSGVTTSGPVEFGVYWDVTGTKEVTEIVWGELKPGQKGNTTVYIKNAAIISIYVEVSWSEESWNPPDASQYFDLTWNFGDAPLGVNRARKVLLQLHVHEDIQGITDFTFNIVITASAEPL